MKLTQYYKLTIQSSCSVVSDSLRPHELQHARPPCPSPTPGVHSNSLQLKKRKNICAYAHQVHFSWEELAFQRGAENNLKPFT